MQTREAPTQQSRSAGGGWSPTETAPAGDRWQSVMVGAYFGFACATDSDGVLDCFGPTTGNPDGPPTDPVLDYSLGEAVGCAVLQDQSLDCWGDANRQPQQGMPPADDGYTAVHVSLGHSCAVTSLGELVCWGDDDQDLPDGFFVDVAATASYTCGLTSAGEIVCGGPKMTDDEVPPPDGTGHTWLSCGFSHCCALTEDRTATCWGLDTHGQLRVPSAIPG